MEPIFRHPFTAMQIGATGSGKTQWLMRFLSNRDELIDKPPAQVLYAYGEYNDAIRDLSISDKSVRCVHGLPPLEDIQSMPKPGLVILDDLMLNLSGGKDKYIDLLYTRGSHNWNVSVICVTQNGFSKELRTARQNSHYLILMRAPQMKLAVRNLGAQLFPGELQFFLEAYKSATATPFSYLLIDLHNATLQNELRLTTNIFPHEQRVAFLP